jgi:hypothetical protein
MTFLPYQGLAQSTAPTTTPSNVSKAKTIDWSRKRVRHDLEPYVCLFENCESPQKLYSHSREWIKHMEKHTLRWRCKAKSHGVLLFEDTLKYESHMQTTHKQDQNKARMFADMNSFKPGTMFTSHPICGRDDVQGIMEHHVIGHMRSIALKSLLDLYNDYESEEGTGKEDNTKTSSVLSPKSSLNKELHNPDRVWEEIRESLNSSAVHKKGAFPCVLAPYGCKSCFSSKKNWKRHMSTQHIKLSIYRCVLCPVVEPDDPSQVYHYDFYREDLFTQHLRRMHTAQHSGHRGLPEYPVTEENIAEHQKRCLRIIRTTPIQSACLFCDKLFIGPQSWDDRIEHIGWHFEKWRGSYPVDVSTWRHDPHLERYLCEEEIIDRDEAGEWKIGDCRKKVSIDYRGDALGRPVKYGPRSKTCWYCGICKDGPHSYLLTTDCTSCGHTRDGCCTLTTI